MERVFYKFAKFGEKLKKEYCFEKNSIVFYIKLI